jgi:small subunit ribosomal protein S20
MAHHASAKKSIRQSIKQNAANTARSSEIKTFVKRVEAAIVAKDLKLAQEALRAAQAKIMKGVEKALFKPNTASRKVSRLTMKVKALESA